MGRKTQDLNPPKNCQLSFRCLWWFHIFLPKRCEASRFAELRRKPNSVHAVCIAVQFHHLSYLVFLPSVGCIHSPKNILHIAID